MNVYSAIADPTRRKILELLAERGPLPAAAIARQFQISPPAVSQHLKTLREANLVVVEKRAQQRIYSINTGAMHDLEVWAGRMAQLWKQRFDAIDEILAAEKQKTAVGTSPEAASPE